MNKAHLNVAAQRQLLIAQAYAHKAIQELQALATANTSEVGNLVDSAIALAMEIGGEIVSEDNPYVDYLARDKTIHNFDSIVAGAIDDALFEYEEEEARFAASLYGYA